MSPTLSSGARPAAARNLFLRIAGHPVIALAAVSLVYWLVTIARAVHEPYTFDEMVTYLVVRRPTLSAMWKTLEAGMDQEMPLMHLLVRFSHWLLGPTHLASRLPSAIGFWILLLSLYAVIRKHLPAPYALAAAIFPLLTYLWPFAWQARAYGVLLGSAAFALWCWQEAAPGEPHRKLALAGITLGLTVALCCHMMALMLAIPFTVAEAARSLQRRRIDWPVWIAFALASPAVAMYPAALAATRDYDVRGLYPRPDELQRFYGYVLSQPAFALLAAVLVAVLVGATGMRGRYRIPAPLAAAFAGFTLQPAIFILIAFGLHKFFFTERYGVLAVIGLGGLLAAGSAWAFRGHVRAGWALFAIMAAWIVYSDAGYLRESKLPPAESFRQTYPVLIDAIQSGQPVVAAMPICYLGADLYLGEEAIRNLTFAYDLQYVLRVPGENIVQRVLIRMKGPVPMGGDVQALEAYLAAHERFLLHSVMEERVDWIYAALLARRCRLTLLRQEGHEALYQVERL